MSVSSPTIRLGHRRFRVDLPHLAFATGITGWAAWFGIDAWQASAEVENLILIAPASFAALVLYLIVAACCFRPADAAAPVRQSRHDGASGGKIAGTMAMLAAFAVAGPLIGFDVAIFVYLLAMLLFLGERRLTVLALLPALLALIVVFGFGTLLDAPLPMLLFGDGS
jgi:hypothetical protein